MSFSARKYVCIEASSCSETTEHGVCRHHRFPRSNAALNDLPMTLDTLINPRHLQTGAIHSARQTLVADRFASVVIDDFLQPSLARGLLSCFERDGDFRPHHSLKQSVADNEPRHEEHYVSEEEFKASPEERWLARELLMVDRPPTDIRSEGWSAHLRFMEMLASPEFQAYLGTITGAAELEDVTYMARTMRHGDLCRAHSDAGVGRKLCLLLYIGDDWKPGFGGRF